MKNKIVLFFTLCLRTTLIFTAPPSLFIENYYGTSITCKINNTNQLVIQSNGVPTYLGTITPQGQTKTAGDVTFLSIWTPYSLQATSLDNYLTQFSQESLQNAGKNAILIIRPSSYISQWDIKPIWRDPNSSSTSFSMKSPETSIEKSNQKDEQTYERQLQKGKINAKQYLEYFETNYNKNDAYERDCFEKLNLLRHLNYNQITQKYRNDLAIYSKLRSFGYPKLLDILANMSFNYQNYLKYPNSPSFQEANLSTSQARTYIKKAIQEQFQLYLQYKKNGWLE